MQSEARCNKEFIQHSFVPFSVILTFAVIIPTTRRAKSKIAMLEEQSPELEDNLCNGQICLEVRI